MVGIVAANTPNYKFALVRFDAVGWQAVEHANWKLVDSLLSLVIGLPNVTGIWENSFAYTVGDRTVDETAGQVYRCLVAHTSPATGTFAAARAANPTYWQALTVTPVFTDDWATATSYSIADIVVVDTHKYYYCAAAHTSGVFATDLAANRWTLIWDATTSVNAADASADAAAASASAASASATTASTAATNAATSATNAATSVTSASTAATTATTQASAAAASAATASDAADAAEAAATGVENLIASGTIGAVRHDVVQTLTDPQKAQARANIGAIIASEVPFPDAADIAFTPGSGISSTDVQLALQELGTSKAPNSHGHSVATALADGFMSSTMFTKLDGIGIANRQVFDASGTWTKPAGLSADQLVLIELWGGGGGGRNSTASSGGGGGAYVRAIVTVGQLGATESVTIGAGGAVNAAGGNSTFAGLTALGGGVSPGGISTTAAPGAPGGVAAAFLGESGGIGAVRDVGNPAGNTLFAGGGGGALSGNTAAGTSKFGGGGGVHLANGSPRGGGGGSQALGGRGEAVITVLR